MKKKWQVPATVIVLLAVLGGMNYVAELRLKKAQDLAKAAEQAKQAAELAVAKGAPKLGASGKPVFALPPDSGPVDAPVRLEVFINNTNSCHEGNLQLMADIRRIYGKSLRMEWSSINDPKASARANKYEIGCEAGLVINGKVELPVARHGGKVLISYRGPAGDKYKIEDVYLGINNQLKEKAKTPPATALAREKLASAPITQ